MAEDLIKKAEELTTAKTGEDTKVKRESPLEEARRLRDESQEFLKNISIERQKMEELAANIALSGRGLAGEIPKVETQDDKDKEEADKIMGYLQ